MVVFDTSILLTVLQENVPASVSRARERVEYLIETLTKTGERIVVPTPALSECLVHAGPTAAQGYLEIINTRYRFRVASFDERAAVEAAVRMHEALPRGSARRVVSRTKIKFDWQIVAIAAVEGATAVYSDDRNVVAYAKEAGMEGYRLEDLPLPPEDLQTTMDFDNPPDV